MAAGVVWVGFYNIAVKVMLVVVVVGVNGNIFCGLLAKQLQIFRVLFDTLWGAMTANVLIEAQH